MLTKTFVKKLFIMNLLSAQLGENLFYFLQMSYTILLLLLFICDNKQNIFFILLRKFLRVDQLICNQEQILKPNLIRY